MSGRLKFLLAVLAAGAGLSFWYAIGSSLTTLSDDGTASILDNSGVNASCDDTDDDGLCDNDETYWNTEFKNPDTDGDGFKDGEEVLTGHDPRKAGPDDMLNDRRNLTERTSSLLLGGLITGDLKPDSPQYEASINALVQEMFEQYAANVATELDSFAVSSGSLDDLISYGLRMTRLLNPLFTEIAANHESFLKTVSGIPLTELSTMEKDHPEAYKLFLAAADAEAAASTARINEVKSVRVPPQMSKFHRALLAYLRGMQQHYVAVQTISRDPLMGMISLQVLQTLATKTSYELTLSFNNMLTGAINSK